ncbi:MAG TPA: hypothetical protein VLV89_13175 [Candidatus Acidoferrum sp.]|nr:hypothetical protein [Candidatus Acidoferrum sp.]
MRNGIAAACLMIASLTPSGLHQDPPKSQAPPQSSTASPRPKTNPIPDTFVNLKVLPKDINKPKLVDVMKRFSITFGVRCNYCHAVSDDLTEGSFDSDEKDTKVKARELIRSILEMNAHSSGG